MGKQTKKRKSKKKTKSMVGWVCGFGGSVVVLYGERAVVGANRLRFGDGFEFGHQLNMQDMVGSLYANKFDYPFDKVPWASASAELLGALFLATDNFNGNRWYERNIFPGQSSMVRWRKFYFRTYDWTYMPLLSLGWGVVFAVLGKVVAVFISILVVFWGDSLGWGFWEGGRCWRRCRCGCFTCGRVWGFRWFFVYGRGLNLGLWIGSIIVLG